MTRVNIEIPDDVHRRIKSVCALQGIVLRDFIAEALERKLRKEGG